LINRYTEEGFKENYQPTLGVNIVMKKLKIEEYEIQIAIWDIAGQDTFHFLRPAFYKASVAAIVVFSLEENDLGTESFKHIPTWYNEIKKFGKWMNISSPSPAIIARLKGQYRYQVLIKSSKVTDAGGKLLRKAILDSFVEFNRKSRYKDVRLICDVDPQSVI